MAKADKNSRQSLQTERSIHSWFAEVLNAARDTQLDRFSKAADWEARRDPGSDPFRLRCREAAAAAYDLAQMAAQCERVGFVPLPFDQYVQLLARLADVGVDMVMRWIGLSSLSKITVESATALARLAQCLGMELRQALVYIRLSFATEALGVPVAALARGRIDTAVGTNSLEQCEASLVALERALNENTRQVLSAIVVEVGRVYGKPLGTSSE